MQKFISEANYATEMARVREKLTLVRSSGYFSGHDGAQLFYVRYDAEAPRGTVLMLHGFGESCDKYHELISCFLADGLSVLIYEQRGHGRSAREVPRGLTHVERFDDYVRDAHRCIKGPLSKCPAPYYLFSHSMGGAVSALLLEGKHPFKRAALCAPMIAMHRRPHLPPIVARIGCNTACLFGSGKRKIPKMRVPDGNKPFEYSSSLSRARYDDYNTLCKASPELFGGAPTFSWTREAMRVTKCILKKGAPESISIPVRVYSAEFDHLVDNDAQQKFIARVPQGKLVFIPQCKHEIYGANDEILHPFLENLIGFLQ